MTSNPSPGSDAGQEPCANGLTACDGTCVDTAVDERHCGGCGRGCLGTDVCEAGRCVPLPVDCRRDTCPSSHYCDLGSGQCKPGCATDAQCSGPSSCDVAQHQCVCVDGAHACGGKCVSNAAVTSCGNACVSCPSVAHGKPTCDGTTCGISCDTGYQACGGACAACPLDNATAFGCAQNTCVATACAAGANLCGGRCVVESTRACGSKCEVCAGSSSSTDAVCQQGQCAVVCRAGTSMCHGHCLTGTCAWAAHRSSVAAQFLALEVDANNRVHIATTSQFKLSYHQIMGAGAPVSESVIGSNANNNSSVCFITEGGISITTPPVIIPDNSGKATLACLRGSALDSHNWNGTSWIWNPANSHAPDWIAEQLGQTGNEVVYFRKHLGFPNERTAVKYVRANGAWTFVSNFTLTDVPLVLNALPSPTHFAALLPGTPRTVKVASSATPLPDVDAVVFGMAANGTLLGLSKSLVLYSYENSAWQPQTVAPATATEVALVVNGALVHVAWINSSGVFLATRMGKTWHVENVSTDVGSRLDLAVGPNGKLAIGMVTASGFVVYD